MLIGHFIPLSLSNWIEEFITYFRRPMSSANPRLQLDEQIQPLSKEVGSKLSDLEPAVHGSTETWIPDDLDRGFIRMVEDGLRKLPDYVRLGQLPLADCIGVNGESRVARGKQIHQLLRAGIESLRPSGRRPATTPPRDWYNYIVLHDAYVMGLRNRDVMARLYISEGTFNRTRRNAVRGVAIWLIEATRQGRNIN